MASNPNPIVRAWRYLRTMLNFKFNEAADPRIQLEQAIEEAQTSHRQLKEHAANVIANQKQTEMKLDRRMGDLEKLQANTRQALLMAEEARAQGNEGEAQKLEATAETLAVQLMAVETEVNDLKELALASASNTEKAKAAVEQSSHMLRNKLSEKQKLVSQLDQAKMHESMNQAMESLTEQVGKDVPTFNEVQEKIERRLAQAQSREELTSGSAEVRMMEVERATQNLGAKARLDELRSELGIASAPAAAPGTAAPADAKPEAQAQEG